MIALEKRPQPSRAWAAATPLLAVLATMIAGGLLFAALGKDPVLAIRTIFWEPLFGEFAGTALDRSIGSVVPGCLTSLRHSALLWLEFSAELGSAMARPF